MTTASDKLTEPTAHRPPSGYRALRAVPGFWRIAATGMLSKLPSGMAHADAGRTRAPHPPSGWGAHITEFASPRARGPRTSGPHSWASASTGLGMRKDVTNAAAMRATPAIMAAE